MKQNASSSNAGQSIRNLQKLIDDLRNRNAVLHARVRFLKQQFQREHAVRLAAAEQIKELEQLIPATEPKPVQMVGRTRGKGRAKGRKTGGRKRGARVSRKRGAKARA